MKRFGLHIAIVLTAVLFGLPANSQNTSRDENLYQVELVVFRNLDQSRTTSEIPQAAEPEIDAVLDQRLARLNLLNNQAVDASGRPVGTSGQQSAGRSGQPRKWFMANSGAQLKSTVSTLQRLQAYDVITHMHWVQEAPDVSQAETISLASLGVNPALLTGEINVYKKRYLHLSVDIELGGSSSQSTSTLFSQILPINEARPALAESRRVRLGRMIYLDQPQFGVIALIREWQPK